jgi:peroxisomal 2,4-dienoyl-CoA reductase
MSFARDLLKGRTALVTGGGTGICRGIALAFARHGCDVAITSRRPEHFEPTVREIEAVGVRALGLAADVREPEAIGLVVDRVGDALGGLDILVNGAAGNFLCDAAALSPNGFGAVVDIDLKGTFHACRAAYPYLVTSGGVILNISATLHYGGTPRQLHVAAAKSGVDALTRTLAVEWGAKGVRVVGLAPGAIDGTEGVERLLPGERRDAAREANPLGRLGTIDDIAGAALFLCSPLASYVNGVTLVVDGGQSLRVQALG